MTDDATRNRREAVNEGLEKAARWHEDQADDADALYRVKLAADHTLINKAARHRRAAAAIRALKEE